MENRKFGNTELLVSPICYGTMRYASNTGEMDETSRNGKRTLEEAIERGVNFIHSSYEYGTRWLTSQVLKNNPKRHDLHHIIKVNVPDWQDKQFSPEKFRFQIEEALQDLHTDRIAVVQHLQRGALSNEIGYNEEGESYRLQEFDSVTEALLEEFDKLKDQGKVGYAVSFPYTVGFAKRVIASGAFSGIAAYFNCLETEMLEVFSLMQDRGMGFIGIRPLAGGLLVNNRVNRWDISEYDRMCSGEWDRLYAHLDELRRDLPEEPRDWSEFALRFSVSDPLVTSTVVGINTREQLESALRAAEAPPVAQEVIDKAHAVNQYYRSTYGIRANSSGIPMF